MSSSRTRSRSRRGPSLSTILGIPTICTTILGCLPSTNAYIPAQPVNDTTRLNLTDASTIFISWVLPAGVYRGPVYVYLWVTWVMADVVDHTNYKQMCLLADRPRVLWCTLLNPRWDRMYRLQHPGSRISRAMSTRQMRVRSGVSLFSSMLSFADIQTSSL
jgi:hypothetical protein